MELFEISRCEVNIFLHRPYRKLLTFIVNIFCFFTFAA